MKLNKMLVLPLLFLPLWALAACDDTMYGSFDPNVSGVQARATLEFVQAVQTSTAQAMDVAERQATIQAGATEDSMPCLTPNNGKENNNPLVIENGLRPHLHCTKRSAVQVWWLD